MPTNTRTGTARDTIHIRTGSTQNSGVCSPTPSQQAGNLDNIISRLERIEAVLSALLGGNVTSNQLSDISGAAGVMTDLIATASNAAGGWTTDGTFTGTAISTLGWTMSDGSQFPIVQMVDGVLQYGFPLNGQSPVTGVGASGNGPRAGIGIAFGATATSVVQFVVGSVAYSVPGLAADPFTTVVFPYSGWYNLNMHVTYQTTNSLEVAEIEVGNPGFKFPSYTDWTTHPDDGVPTSQRLSTSVNRWYYAPTGPVTVKAWSNDTSGAVEGTLEVVVF